MGRSLPYTSFLEVGPATGATLDGAFVNMFSTFTWNCNPKDPDQGCALFPCSSASGAAAMCYVNAAAQRMYPCSSANVFTPYVQGEKVLPIYWLRVEPTVADDTIDLIISLLDTRFALSILIIIVPILSVIILGFLWYRIVRKRFFPAKKFVF